VLQVPPAAQSPGKKSVDVNSSSFATFSEKKVATSMKKFIVPWSIAIHGLSFTKPMKLENIKEMLIAIINEQQIIL
jgi:hypothetical protein